MTPTLSICISLLNDPVEIVETIKSIRATAPAHLQICVVDDASKTRFTSTDPRVNVKRFEKGVGVGRSRWAAVALAEGSHILIIDSHMRFEPGWYEKIMARIEASPLTTWCVTCLGLSAKSMDLAKSRASYTGATLCLIDNSPRANPLKAVLEGKWKRHSDGEEMACLMGACYFIPREVFIRLELGRGFRAWGTWEPAASLTIWLAGYDIRFAGDVRIGHMFRDTSPYTMNTWEITMNKVWSIYTILGDSDEAMMMLGKLKSVTVAGDWRRCMNEAVRIKAEIVSTRSRYAAMFTRDLQWYCDHFKIPLPTI